MSVGNAPDDPEALRRIAAATRGVDLLVTTGGASVGEHDLVREVLAEDGFDLDFWQIAMRPGKPLMVGRYRGTPMLGLPGNPVSTFVCAMLFLVPAIERLSGVAATEAAATARLGAAVAANDRRQDYLRARLARADDGIEEAAPFEVQDSSMMRLLGASRLSDHAPAARPRRRGRGDRADPALPDRRAADLKPGGVGFRSQAVTNLTLLRYLTQWAN